MVKGIKVFGVPFDPPNSPERLNLKLAYLSHLLNNPLISSLKETLDPHDIIRANLGDNSVVWDAGVWLGKMPVDSWLTPRPLPVDFRKLTIADCLSFLEANGCWDYALKVSDFVKKKVLPDTPVMIGVDHSSTGGLLLALKERFDNLNVVVLDAHFDVITPGSLMFDNIAGRQNRIRRKNMLHFYHCGNFLAHILEKNIIRPENLWVLGVQDTAELHSEAEKWLDRGVHVLFKNDVLSASHCINLTGPTHVSIDMDIGSLSSVTSARFMNCYGLTLKEFLSTLLKVAMSIKEANVPLAGLDIMEIDIHFLEANRRMHIRDSTMRIVREIFKHFIEGNISKPGGVIHTRRNFSRPDSIGTPRSTKNFLSGAACVCRVGIT